MKTAEPSVDNAPLLSRGLRLRRRIFLFSLAFGLIASLLGTIPFLITEVYLPNKRLQESNQKTFQKTRCEQEPCEISGIANNWEFEGADYVLDKETSFLLNINPPPAVDFSRFTLHRSDPAFMGRFRVAACVETPAGELWRLCSTVKQLGSKRLAIMVGYAEIHQLRIPADSEKLQLHHGLQ